MIEAGVWLVTIAIWVATLAAAYSFGHLNGKREVIEAVADKMAESETFTLSEALALMTENYRK